MTDGTSQHGCADRTLELLRRSLFENPLYEVHVWEVDRDDRGEVVGWHLQAVNAAALATWGVELEDVLGKSVHDIFPNTNPLDLFGDVVGRALETGEPQTWELAFPGTDQVLRMVTTAVGECFISIGQDVTAERQLQEQHAASLAQLNQAIDSGGVGIWDWDIRSNHTAYSDAWKAQLGYAADEIEDDFEEWRSRCHPDDLEATLARVTEALDDPVADYSATFRLRHRDGSWRWIHARGRISRDSSGHPIRMVGAQVDITEQRRLMERVRRAEKLDSLGTLSAGIAHDFNNILTAITQNLSTLAEHVRDPEGRGVLDDLASATHGAQSLTTQLLTFSKGGQPLRDVTSLREIILDSASFVNHGSRCRLKYSIADDLMAARVDAGQVSQVIGNLVINADQAMPEGGVIEVTAENVLVHAGHGEGLAPGNYVRITVTDSGCGIPEELLPRIFDPFFTTKTSGSGLGLATSHSIMAAHGGDISVTSAVGEGTSFEVMVPATTEQAPTPDVAEVQSGKGRILVMDDSALVLKASLRTLEQLGYDAVGVPNGDEAVKRLDEALAAANPFDLVILDLTIPGYPGGDQVLRELRTIDASIPAIVVSGYADNDVLARHSDHGFQGRLAKPFDTVTLSNEVARVLRAGVG